MVQVVLGERVEQQAADDLDVTGQDLAEEGQTLLGDGHQGGALVVGARRAGDEAGLLQQPRLVGQAAAAVDDAVGQLRHGQLTVVGGEARQQLKLDRGDVRLGAQVLLHLVLEQADGFHEREVGPSCWGSSAWGSPSVIRFTVQLRI
ncbi:hypothetical protein Phou_052190 [Phytohabitans houttuyneae]|uniref:Uncharacterized protein n=1 Tax=Phytohabitans houttuyneae TaxID=1076126 RepID=A0A6V8KG27_9ACTN|nr:hypothetical protein Phou_052190 [Phytohabitans houttuyneae]